jgi:hypothetical protein
MADKQIFQLTANISPATSHYIPMQDSAGASEAVKVTIAQLKTVFALAKADVGLSNVDNTSDVNKPVSTAQAAAIALKANIASPTFTGVPAAPTASLGTNTTQIASTAFVKAALDAATIYFDAATLSGTGTIGSPITVIGGGGGITTGTKGDINVVGVNTDWQIVANAVGTTEIAASAVTLAKLANFTAGSKLLGAGAAGATPVEIALGSGFSMSSNTLTYTGGAASISFQDEGSAVVSASTLNFVGSGVTLTNVGGVATATIAGGGGSGVGTVLVDWTTVTAVATVDISINSWYTTYKRIEIELADFQPVNATNFYIRVSADNSTYQTTGYFSTFCQGATIASGPSSGFQVADFLSNVATESTKGKIELMNTGDATIKPTLGWNFRGWYGTGSNNAPYFFGGGGVGTAQATKAIRLVMNSGNVAKCTYRVIGY